MIRSGSARLMAAARTLAVPRRRIRPGRVAHQDGLGGTHRQRRTQAAGLTVRGHRDQRDLAAARLVASCRPISTPNASDSSRISLPSRTSVWVVRVELAGACRVGDLLHTDDDVHAFIASISFDGRQPDPEHGLLPSASRGRRTKSDWVVPRPAGVPPAGPVRGRLAGRLGASATTRSRTSAWPSMSCASG